MDTIQKLINELETIDTMNYSFIPSLIKEFNIFVFNKLLKVLNMCKTDYNKYHILSMMVKIGLELENTFQVNKINNDIISQQMSFYSSLANPIISKIREICLELNFELVYDLKNTINNLINDEQDKYNELNKYIKFMQINSFCRNINYVIGKEVMFEDFGITIKISNPHYRNIFKDLIDEIELLSPNDNNKDKRFDWYWKACESNFNTNTNINTDINTNNVLMTNINNQENNFIDTVNNENIISIENNMGTENVLNFKIIQMQPEIIQQVNNNPSENYNIINQTKEQITKNISNSIIIEDDSFTIPIDNIYNIDNTSNVDNINNTDNSTIITNSTYSLQN